MLVPSFLLISIKRSIKLIGIFLWKVLHKLNFGTNFIKWIKIFV